MKNELIDFVNNELGYFMDVKVSRAIKKYFKGKEVEWIKHCESKSTYIHETHSLSCDNGELSMYGDFGTLVFNCESLFIDLPIIVRLVYEARAETDKMIKEQVEEVTRLVTQ